MKALPLFYKLTNVFREFLLFGFYPELKSLGNLKETINLKAVVVLVEGLGAIDLTPSEQSNL